MSSFKELSFLSSFSMPWAYHYANRPDLSALRVRDVVFSNFNTGIGGVSLRYVDRVTAYN